MLGHQQRWCRDGSHSQPGHPPPPPHHNPRSPPPYQTLGIASAVAAHTSAQRTAVKSNAGVGGPIFSVDVHPHGTRFATAGSDHKVKVWNLLPVLNVHQELSSDTPKLLATLADHFGPVNVARFSHNGRFLASGMRVAVRVA